MIFSLLHTHETPSPFLFLFSKGMSTENAETIDSQLDFEEMKYIAKCNVAYIG